MSDNIDNKTCNICGKHFDFPCLLERHKNGKRKCKPKKQQNIQEQIIINNNEDEDASENENENNDNNNNLASNLKEFICEHCNRKCASKYSLDRHITTCKIFLQNIQRTTSQVSFKSNQKDIPVPDFLLEIINDYRNIINALITNNNSGNLNNNIVATSSTTPIITPRSNTFANILNKNNIENSIQNSIQNNIQNTIKNNIQNTQNTQNTQNNILKNTQNIQSNSNNNITTNNNISLPNIINPFGCEDISFITDDEKLEILKSYNGVELALEKVYSKPENRNFYKPNANKDNVSILNKDMKIQVKKQKQFNEQMINHGLLAMERMFYSCKNRLSFEDQLLIWNNIEENRDLLRFESNITQILSVMETCFQDAISKEIFKKFSDKINREETFILEKINIVKELLLELERFNNDRNNVTIDDKFLRNEVWTKEEATESDVDGSDSKNNLAIRHLKNTPRFSFFEEMKQNEFEYFDMHGTSIGNIIEYRKILLQRAKDEIERITNEYKNHKINDNGNLTSEVKDKLINEPRMLMRNNLAKVKFNDKR